MLHVTTEIGMPGKAERERKHFPRLFNQPSACVYKPHGRRYIPHGRSDEEDFRPHPHHLCPQYTVNGPDWHSRLRWIPSPKPENCKPGPEIWPEPWKSLRTFPWMAKRTSAEWTLYPEAEDITLRCKWGNIHKATSLSDNELTHNMLFGRGRKLPAIDKRNGLKLASPGDKSYQAVEYSSDFHKEGSTRPVVNFGGNMIIKPDTFVPLQDMPSIPRESYFVKEKRRQVEEEARDVQNLENWRPATPLAPQSGPSVTVEDKTVHQL